MAGIQRILIPTAFSELSRRAAEYVRLVAPAVQAHVHVVHIVPDAPVLIDPGLPGAAMPVPGPSTEELLIEARLSLEAFVRDNLAEWSDHTRIFAHAGDVAEELLRHVHQHAIDLIIMGTRADGVLKRLIWGSVGRSVLERSPCPVLLVPMHDAPRG